MAISPGDFLRVTVSTLMPNASIAQNVFYLLVNSLGGGNDNTVLDDIESWVESVYTQLAPILSDQVAQVFIEVGIQILLGAISPVGSVAINLVGSASADMASHGVAGQSNATLEGGGRPSIKFWPGVNEAGIQDGEFLPFDLLTMLNAQNAVVGGPNLTSPQGDYLSGIIKGDTSAFVPFTGTIVAKVFPGYQRRRKPGVGS